LRTVNAVAFEAMAAVGAVNNHIVCDAGMGNQALRWNRSRVSTRTPALTNKPAGAQHQRARPRLPVPVIVK